MVRNLCLNQYGQVEPDTETSTDDSKASTDDSKAERDDEEVEEDEFCYENEFEDDEDLDDSYVSSRDGDYEFEEYPHKVVADVDELIKTYANKDISDFVTRITSIFPKT